MRTIVSAAFRAAVTSYSSTPMTWQNSISEQGDLVTLTTEAGDGVERSLSELQVVPYDIPRRSIAGYYPECNVLIPLWHFAEGSKVPASKSVSRCGSPGMRPVEYARRRRNSDFGEMKRFAGRMDRNEACGPGLEMDRSMLEAYMRKFAISVAAAAVLAGAPVLAQSVGEKTGINSALEISPTTADFVKEAATSDMLEIEAAKIAETQGQCRGKKVR